MRYAYQIDLASRIFESENLCEVKTLEHKCLLPLQRIYVIIQCQWKYSKYFAPILSSKHLRDQESRIDWHCVLVPIPLFMLYPLTKNISSNKDVHVKPLPRLLTPRRLRTRESKNYPRLCVVASLLTLHVIYSLHPCIFPSKPNHR